MSAGRPRRPAAVAPPPVRIRTAAFRDLLEDEILGALRLGFHRGYKYLPARHREPCERVREAVVSEQAKAVELVLDELFDFAADADD